MDESKLINYIIELEAKLLTTEKYLNEIAELNKLKIPTEEQVIEELFNQRKVSKKKYEKLRDKF